MEDIELVVLIPVLAIAFWLVWRLCIRDDKPLKKDAKANPDLLEKVEDLQAQLQERQLQIKEMAQEIASLKSECIKKDAQIQEEHEKEQASENALLSLQKTFEITSDELATCSSKLSSITKVAEELKTLAAQYILGWKREQLEEKYSSINYGQLGIPKSVYFIRTRRGIYPVNGFVDEHAIYGSFTVYVADRGTHYHTNYYCGNA